jgi:hypothetical protein
MRSRRTPTLQTASRLPQGVLPVALFREGWMIPPVILAEAGAPATSQWRVCPERSRRGPAVSSSSSEVRGKPMRQTSVEIPPFKKRGRTPAMETRGSIEPLDFPNCRGRSCDMPLPDNVDFCCLALVGPHLEVSGASTLLPGLTVSNSTAPVELDNTWKSWLGTIQADSFKRSSLVIMAQHYSSRAGASEAIRFEYRAADQTSALRINSRRVRLQLGGVDGGRKHVEWPFAHRTNYARLDALSTPSIPEI